MQPEAIPFAPNPRAFGLAVFLLIVMVYAIRFVIRHVLSRWPLLQKELTLWIKMEKLGKPADTRQVQREV